jgi:hypothetical protein
MITYAQENLSTDEFMLFLDLLVPEPEPEPEPEVVKPAKKRHKPRGKSARAVALSEQLKNTGKPHLDEGPVCGICSHTEEYEDHLQPSPHYHEFQPPQRAAAVGTGIQSADTGPLL